jgi:hypothetical protein
MRHVGSRLQFEDFAYATSAQLRHSACCTYTHSLYQSCSLSHFRSNSLTYLFRESKEHGAYSDYWSKLRSPRHFPALKATRLSV